MILISRGAKAVQKQLQNHEIITSFWDRRIAARLDEAVKKERQACVDICKKIVHENQIIEAWNWSAKRAINAIEARNN